MSASIVSVCGSFPRRRRKCSIRWSAIRRWCARRSAGGHENGGILIDPIHFDRGGSSAGEISGVPRARFRYMQLCDAPAERPTDVEGLLHQARAERLMPGDGGLDLAGILRAVPADL